MTPEQIQELIDKLFAIAGSAASQGWDLAIRQVYADAAVSALWGVLGVGVVLGGLRLANESKRVDPEGRSTYDDDRHHYDEEARGWFVGGGVCVVVIGGMIVAFALSALLPRLINPGWYAVQMLMGLVQ